jgi:hypothetical protein
MNATRAVRLPAGDESIAPVTILDAQGHVVRVVSVEEFRQTHPTGARIDVRPAGPTRRHGARRLSDSPS